MTGLASVVTEIVREPDFSPTDPSLTLGDWIKIAADIVTNALIVIGLVSRRRSRMSAYLWLKSADLGSLLLVQFFSFFEGGWQLRGDCS